MSKKFLNLPKNEIIFKLNLHFMRKENIILKKIFAGIFDCLI